MCLSLLPVSVTSKMPEQNPGLPPMSEDQKLQLVYRNVFSALAGLGATGGHPSRISRESRANRAPCGAREARMAWGLRSWKRCLGRGGGLRWLERAGEGRIARGLPSWKRCLRREEGLPAERLSGAAL